MSVHARAYRNDDADWSRVRELLVASHREAIPGWSWDVRRWDGLRFHRELPILPVGIAARSRVWEDDAGRVLGIVHPEHETAPEAFLEVDPGARRLEPAMLDWAVANLSTDTDGTRRLDVTVLDEDLARRRLLEARGFRMLDRGTWHRRRSLAGAAVRSGALAAPYRLATTSAPTAREDGERMAALLNAAFGRTIHTGAEYVTFMAHSPSFRHDLNLLAVAPNGAFAAHVGVTLDDANRHGIFEPVCTHPDHVRRGLARSLMLEGVRRLRDLGAATASVETGDMVAANALYAGTGFTETHRAHTWRREWPGPARD